MKNYNRAVAAVPSSGIRQVFELSRTIEDCIHMEVGEPDFRTPGHILEAVAQAAHDGFSKYVEAAGIPELIEAISEKVTAMHGFSVGPENVVVTPGAVTSILSVLIVVTEPGDEVMVPDPGWPNYIIQVVCAGAVPVRYPLLPEAGFQIDFDALERLVTPRTKLIIVNTPGNPTGAVFDREAVERIVEFARRNDLFVIADEVYEEILYEGEHISFGRYNDDGRIAVVFGMSKTYAAPGLRIGYTVCAEPLAALVTKLQQALSSCATGVSQKGSVAALKGPQDAVHEMVAAYRQRRDTAVRVLSEYGLHSYTPHGAFYQLIDISAARMNSTDFALSLLKEDRVAVAPGDTFGDTTASYVRIAFTTDVERLERGVRILCERLASARS